MPEKFYEASSVQQIGVFGQGVTLADVGSQSYLAFEIERKADPEKPLSVEDRRLARQYDPDATTTMF